MKNKCYGYLWDWSSLSNEDIEGLKKNLSSSELDELHGQKSKKRQHEFISSRFFIRKILTSDFNIQVPEKIQVDSNGKPLPIHPWQVSWSHSHKTCLFALSQCETLGVDIEHARFRESFYKILEKIGHPDELDIFLKLPTEEQSLYFYTLWTLKEAFGKSTGLGLQEDLRDLKIDLKKNAASGSKVKKNSQFKSLSVNHFSIALFLSSDQPLEFEIKEARLVENNKFQFVPSS